jgi:hypothetical protein
MLNHILQNRTKLDLKRHDFNLFTFLEFTYKMLQLLVQVKSVPMSVRPTIYEQHTTQIFVLFGTGAVSPSPPPTQWGKVV